MKQHRGRDKQPKDAEPQQPDYASYELHLTVELDLDREEPDPDTDEPFEEDINQTAVRGAIMRNDEVIGLVMASLLNLESADASDMDDISAESDCQPEADIDRDREGCVATASSKTVACLDTIQNLESARCRPRRPATTASTRFRLSVDLARRTP